MPSRLERIKKILGVVEQKPRIPRASVEHLGASGFLIASSGLKDVGEQKLASQTYRGILENKGIIEKTIFMDGSWQYLIGSTMLGESVPEDFNDWKNYLDVYYYSPQVSTAIDLKQSLIWQMGYDLEGSDSDVKKITNWLTEIDGDKTLRDDSFWALLFGNMYWHIEDGKPVALNPMTVGIKKNDDDTIVHYSYQPRLGKSITFPPEEILHLKYNAKPWDLFGCAPFRKIYPTAKIIVDMESDLPIIVKRRADPPIAIQIGEPSGPNMVSDETFKQLKGELINRKAGDDIVHDGVFKFEEVYTSGGVGARQTVEPLIDHFMANLVAAVSVPEIALGHGGTTTMATAEYQERILQSEIRAYQRALKRFHENFIFPLAGVQKGTVKLNWRPMTPEDKEKDSRRLIGEIQTGIVSPAYARKKLGYPEDAGIGAVMSIQLQPVGTEAPTSVPPPSLPKLQAEYLKIQIEKEKAGKKTVKPDK